MKRPLIGLNCDVAVHDDKTLLFQVRAPYARAVWKAGGRPVLIPPIARNEPELGLEGLHGLLAIGGDDMEPERYGKMMRRPEEVPLHPLREAFDFALIEAAVRKPLPLLCVCCGLQELAVAFGGTIHQFIPDDVPHALEHRVVDDKISRHEVNIEKGSFLEKALGARIDVNSTHKQAVASPGDGQAVTARAPDGVIEALECVGPCFTVGVQWHPELILDEPGQLDIFKGLVEAAGNRGFKKVKPDTT